MKNSLKRILSATLALCLAAALFCTAAETVEAANYNKTIKKTIKFKACQRRTVTFKMKSTANVTITATLKGSSNSGQYVGIETKGKRGKYLQVFGQKNKQKSKLKVKLKKGTQTLNIGSGGRGTVKLTIEIKAKKSILKSMTVKKPAKEPMSSDDER